jgi:hypothetical protein
MPTPETPSPETPSPDDIAQRIREAGERARAEAQARRAQQAQKAAVLPEIGGPRGPEPTRYGDWERNGIVSDF